ncbi:translation machinery associated tma7 protein [Toxoplasma gondii ME49]|uniref:Translation machinery associated tma7 protein n=3 Tax=Toxoplasma gondii TaxID=5811 RepID=B6KHI4_TOXGV|nr:translation machinery associated tma7 protein [Toxoplasma gondii ME49]EPT25131.1 translation machinery associated tma7 protein [Toxoplasma gondii ME49]ESS34385.1 translation machinery associated tma7 protein [Toxoplasma gondii VEG]|eukprot:XP_002367307.1 translation machinery associated tma7 protein [Toxoplasma gondii ME49]
MTFVLTAGEKDYADARVTISVELRLLSSGKGFIGFSREMSPARNGHYSCFLTPFGLPSLCLSFARSLPSFSFAPVAKMPTGNQGGKRKPLKQPKKASCEDETDMEFKKKQSQQAREEEAARKALLAKSAAKKK